MGESSESAALVHRLVQLGKVLGLKTVAEGIETEQQWTLLKSEGVDIGQGYLFVRPQEANNLLHLLGTRTTKPSVHVTYGTARDRFGQWDLWTLGYYCEGEFINGIEHQPSG